MQDAYTSINDIVNDAQIMLELPNHARSKLAVIASNWVSQQYTVKHQKFTKVVNIEVPEEGNLWVPAPADMIDWIQIGIQHGDVIQILDYNNKLSKIAPNSKTLPRYGWGGQPLGPDDTYYYLPYFDGAWRSLRWSTQNYGRGYGEYNGQFTYDAANRRFIFAKPWPSKEAQVYLEYQYSMQSNMDYPIIEPLAAVAILNYVLSQYLLTKNDARYKVYDAMYRENMVSYTTKKRMPLIQEMLAAFRDNTTIGIK